MLHNTSLRLQFNKKWKSSQTLNAFGGVFLEKTQYTLLFYNSLKQVSNKIYYVRFGMITLQNLLWFLFHSASCSKDYLPPDCMIRKCKARNDGFGHYTCLNETTKQCLQGWLDTSTNCTKREYTKYTLIVFDNRLVNTISAKFCNC